MLHKSQLGLKLTNKHHNIEGRKGEREGERRRKKKEEKKGKQKNGTKLKKKNQKTSLWGQNHKKTNNTVIN